MPSNQFFAPRNMMRPISSCLLLALLMTPEVGRTSPPAHEAMPLFLIDSPWGDVPTTIYTVDSSNGSLRQVASLDPKFTPSLGLAAASGSILLAAVSDGTVADCCLGAMSCLLIRIVLTPESSTPQEVSIIAPIHAESGIVTEVTGLSFRADGRLYAISQASDALYIVDPSTALAVEAGPLGIDQHGGDLSFGADGRLWAWSNIEDGAGLYELDPDTGFASAFELHPFTDFSGLAAVGHGEMAHGASPQSSELMEFALPVGVTGGAVPLTVGGVSFNHIRGDLDSPFCDSDTTCDDGVAFTLDVCQQGGCMTSAIAGCCVADADCMDGDACKALEHCDNGTCAWTPETADLNRDGTPDCGQSLMWRGREPEEMADHDLRLRPQRAAGRDRLGTRRLSGTRGHSWHYRDFPSTEGRPDERKA